MSKNKVYITLDIDWASDEIIEYCINLLLRYKAKVTWFITHDSPVTRKLSGYPKFFDIGIHPNFLESSTQGRNVREVMDYLLGIYPKARCMRTHSLYQSSPMFSEILKRYPQIKLDVSLFMPDCTGVRSHKLNFGRKHIVRIPYVWEDDFEILAGFRRRQLGLVEKFRGDLGYKILDFHPIHVVLNSRKTDNYERFKVTHDIRRVSLKQALKFRNNEGKGTEDFLTALLSSSLKAARLSETGLY